MRNGTYYLNQSGHRFVIYRNGQKQRVKVQGVIRSARCFTMLGNTAYVTVYIKGKKVETFNYELVGE